MSMWIWNGSAHVVLCRAGGSPEDVYQKTTTLFSVHIQEASFSDSSEEIFTTDELRVKQVVEARTEIIDEEAQK